MIPAPYEEVLDDQLFPLGVWREADNQGVEGMRGVAHSIWNRSLSPLRWWGGPDLRSILLRSSKSGVYQYDCFDPKDADSKRWPEDDNPQWIQAQQICANIATDPDNTDGATTYYSNDIAAPWWAARMTKTVQIDRLLFFK